jgi:hypothetical protein
MGPPIPFSFSFVLSFFAEGDISLKIRFFADAGPPTQSDQLPSKGLCLSSSLCPNTGRWIRSRRRRAESGQQVF